WAWDGTCWSLLCDGASCAAPDYVESPTYALDPGTHGLLRMGGEALPGLPGNHFIDELWLWQPSAWSQVCGNGVASCSGPAPLEGAASAFDSHRGVAVMFGGFDTAKSDRTWEWDGGDWTPVCDACTPRPAARVLPAMAYDSDRQVVVVFG